jgi:hypothetical protein
MHLVTTSFLVGVRTRPVREEEDADAWQKIEFFWGNAAE